MKAKLKDGRTLPIEEHSVIALNDNGETLEVPVEEIESIGVEVIDWYKLRIDIVMELLRKSSAEDIRSSYFESNLVKMADRLIEKLKKNK